MQGAGGSLPVLRYIQTQCDIPIAWSWGLEEASLAVEIMHKLELFLSSSRDLLFRESMRVMTGMR